jgi:hypothetical protein
LHLIKKTNMDFEILEALPSLTPFHKHLCSLNFYKDFKDQTSILSQNIETKDDQPQTSVVGETLSESFDTPYDYIREWEEVFLIEARAQIIRGSFSEKQQVDKVFLKGVELEDIFYIMDFNIQELKGTTYRVFDFVLLAKTDVLLC